MAQYCKAGFTGASFLSYLGVASYTFNPKWTIAMRAEQFRNPNGYFLEPMAAAVSNENNGIEAPPLWGGIKGAFNDITWGVNFNPRMNFRLRPEIRYDWQTGNYRFKGFGQNNPNGVTSSSQVTASMDAVFYF